MTKLLYWISATLAVLLTYACGKSGQSGSLKDKITLAESVIDSMPDSTLSILRDMDMTATPELKGKAHYLTGTAKLKLWDFNGAITHLLSAEKEALNNNDNLLAAMAQQRVMELYEAIDSKDASLHYALKALNTYSLCNDTVNRLGIIEKYVKNNLQFLSMPEQFDSLTTILNTLASHSDNPALADLAKAATSYNQELPATIEAFDNAELNLFTHGLADSLYNGGDWESIFINDSTGGILPATIRKLAKNLCENGKEKLSHDLLERYFKYYAVEETWDSYIKKDNKRICPKCPIYFLPLSRQSILREYIPEVEMEVKDFHYNEIVLREQTIRHQHEMIVIISVSCGLLICLLVMGLLLIKMRKRRMEEDNMRSAMELRIALNQSKDQWLRTLTHLCDTYYKAYAKEATRSKSAQEALSEINAASESTTFFQQLEQKLNSMQDNVCCKFRDELPDLREDEYRLFMLNALGFSIPTLSLLLKEKREVIYNRRVRLRSKIQELAPPHTDLFLKALE